MKKIDFYKNLPDTPGVYLMKNVAGEIICVGKAGNLKQRVSSYFLRPHDSRIEQLIRNIAKMAVPAFTISKKRGKKNLWKKSSGRIWKR